MDIVYFFVRYIPWWCVPICIISSEFAYIYWLKSIKRASWTFIILAAITFLLTIFYYWAGGPDKSVRFLINLLQVR